MSPGRRAARALSLAVLFQLATIAAAADARSGLTPPDYPQIGLPNRAAAQELLDRFRGAGFASGDYYLEFDLRERPRRGDERTVPGRLWGGRSGGGAAVRIELWDAAAPAVRILLENGPQAQAWRSDGGAAARIGESGLLDPLVAGSDITAFDLQMPYLYWTDSRVVSLNRVRNRPAYTFLFRPPAAFAAAHPGVTAVRAYLDTEYDRPLQIELLGRDGGIVKMLSIVDLKKVDGQWLLKTFDVRNELTRDYTRFDLTGAALGLSLPGDVLSPPGLAGAAAVPPSGRVVRFGP